MEAMDYLHMQLRLEGKSMVGADSLRRVEIVPNEDMPLMVIAKLADNQMIAYYDESLSTELHTELAERIHNTAFPKIDLLREFLVSQSIPFEVGHYKTNIFPLHFMNSTVGNVVCHSKRDSKIQVFGFDGFAEQIYAIEQDGKIISACVSTRENDSCGEAWVYTDSQYRHRGFAQQVVITWARSLVSANKVPFYSHHTENVASANLAKRLGLQPVFEEIVISYSNV